MKKRHSLIKMSGGACLALFSLIAVSCAQDGFDDDERWTTSVRNTQLETPAVEQIEIAASADESQTIITWPVVHGAGGYICSLYDVSNPDNPVVVDGVDSKLIDGCTLTISREEDSKYKFSIRTAGNEELNNKEAETTSEKEFSTFTPTYTTIPDGVDLYQWFQENPVPVGEEANAIKAELYAESGLKTEEIYAQALNYDLAPGGEYILSQSLDFLGSNVTLRASKSQYANLKMLGGATCFSTYAPFSLKYLDVDCSETDNAVIELSKTPDEAIKGATGGGDYYNIIGGSINLTKCNFVNVKDKILFDNSVKYCVETFIMNDCMVQLATAEGGISGQAMVYFKSGFVKDIIIRNSTWFNTTENSSKYFIQYNNSGRIDRAGYDKNSQTQSVNFINNTFYNICKNNDSQWCNYGGFNGQKYTNFEVTGNIWYGCAPNGGGIARRICGGRGASSYGKCLFNNNTYWVNGASETGYESYDTGNVLQTDPAFANPANGDFTPTGADQLQYKAGAPRWITDNQ